MSVLMLAWAAASVVCQQFLESRRWSIPARFVWGTLDSLLLLAMLLVADGAASPLVVGYPLLIVGSGLWFRVRFVWFMTALSLLSYGILVVDFYLWRPELQRYSSTAPRTSRHVIFALSLVVHRFGRGLPGPPRADAQHVLRPAASLVLCQPWIGWLGATGSASVSCGKALAKPVAPTRQDAASTWAVNGYA